MTASLTAQKYAKCQKIVHQGSTKIRIQPQTFISRIYVGEMRPLFIFVPLLNNVFVGIVQF